MLLSPRSPWGCCPPYQVSCLLSGSVLGPTCLGGPVSAGTQKGAKASRSSPRTGRSREVTKPRSRCRAQPPKPGGAVGKALGLGRSGTGASPEAGVLHTPAPTQLHVLETGKEEGGRRRVESRGLAVTQEADPQAGTPALLGSTASSAVPQLPVCTPTVPAQLPPRTAPPWWPPPEENGGTSTCRDPACPPTGPPQDPAPGGSRPAILNADGRRRGSRSRGSR